jgi:hypothetical protein
MINIRPFVQQHLHNPVMSSVGSSLEGILIVATLGVDVSSFAQQYLYNLVMSLRTSNLKGIFIVVTFILSIDIGSFV